MQRQRSLAVHERKGEGADNCGEHARSTSALGTAGIVEFGESRSGSCRTLEASVARNPRRRCASGGLSQILSFAAMLRNSG